MVKDGEEDDNYKDGEMFIREQEVWPSRPLLIAGWMEIQRFRPGSIQQLRAESQKWSESLSQPAKRLQVQSSRPRCSAFSNPPAKLPKVLGP